MITTHTRERIWRRLKGIVNEHDVYEMTQASEHFTSGKHYVKVRSLSRIHYLDDSVGDTLACIVHDGNVITAMLCLDTQTWHDGKTWRVDR
jgi:hypothetical protein